MVMAHATMPHHALLSLIGNADTIQQMVILTAVTNNW